MDVLTRASKENINLIVTLEPTFFGQLDAQPVPVGAGGGGRGQSGVNLDDPVYAAKKEFIRKNGLVVWRFTDHWRARKPDPFAAGLTGAPDGAVTRQVTIRFGTICRAAHWVRWWIT